MKFPFFLALLFCISVASAQQDKKKHIYFFDSNYKEVPTKDSAYFIREVTEPDSGKAFFTVRESYKDGTTRLTAQSSSLDPIVLQDNCTSYYPNGKKKFEAHYEAGILVGKTFRYYPDGKPYILMDIPDKTLSANTASASEDSVFVTEYDNSGNPILQNGNGHYKLYDDDFKNVIEEGEVKNSKPDGVWEGYNSQYGLHYKEQYVAGKLISGTSIDGSGKNYDYKERVTKAQFVGGSVAMRKYLAETLSFPKEAALKGVHGTVVCQFVVGPDGKFSSIKVIRHIDKSLDNEAMLVLATMPLWQAGTYRGKPVEQVFTMPVSFNNKINESPFIRYMQ